MARGGDHGGQKKREGKAYRRRWPRDYDSKGMIGVNGPRPLMHAGRRERLRRVTAAKVPRRIVRPLGGRCWCPTLTCTSGERAYRTLHGHEIKELEHKSGGIGLGVKAEQEA